jgi:hypothetical protein
MLSVLGAGDRAPLGSFSIDGLAEAEAQRIDVHLCRGVTGKDCTLARRAACQPPEGLQASGERCLRRVRARSAGRNDHQIRR